VIDLPDAGDPVWMNFSPQAGNRPGLVLSPRIYHERTALAVLCPITSNTRPYPF
jgi:mRNA interferase MazF